jgi:DNA-binding SARP family transcriptional activator
MERDLLLALYCADGGTLSPPRLAELLWDRAGERSPVTLRRHISGARKAAAGEVVVTRRHRAGATAYGLGIDRDHIDASRFEQQVADGGRQFRQDRYAESASTLGRALALWRGAPLADAGSRPFARAQITRLENTHRTAVLTKLKADISLGQHREATGELEALTLTRPEDGEVRRLLVICLYRSERPIEATRACRQAIRTLLSQGLSDRHLQELQHDMLTGVLPRHGSVVAQASRLVSTAR